MFSFFKKKKLQVLDEFKNITAANTCRLDIKFETGDLVLFVLVPPDSPAEFGKPKEWAEFIKESVHMAVHNRIEEQTTSSEIQNKVFDNLMYEHYKDIVPVQ